MAISGFKRLKTKDPELDRVQTNIGELSTQLEMVPLLDGHILKDIALSTSATMVEHKLGRKPLGWIIVRKNAAQDIYESGSSLDTKYLTLTAAGTVTASIWVF